MPSFGESHILVTSRHVGIASVADILPATAAFPRLDVHLGMLLQDNPDALFEADRPVVRFELRDIRGDLALADGVALGALNWAGPRRFVRSAAYPSENRIVLNCDLDAGRIARIEESRAGKEATFALSLWPTLVDAQGYLDATIEPIRFTVPRDKWIGILAGFSHTKYEVVEIPYPSLQEPEFEATMSHIRDAISRLNRGDFDEAVGACRRAIETLAATLNVSHKGPDLEAALIPATDPKRAEAYAGILVRLKNLGNLTVHRRTATPKYTRAEAQFVVAATSHAAALIAKLIHR